MMIQGVLGPIDTAELGQTLMHEHITCADWSMRMNFGARFFEFDQVAEIAAGQLGKAKALGVRTVVDGTPVNLGRDIRLIREVARHEKTLIPEDFEYADLTGLTLEAREKLARIRPKNLGHCSLPFHCPFLPFYARLPSARKRTVRTGAFLGWEGCASICCCAPPTISVISWVMAACRARLYRRESSLSISRALLLEASIAIMRAFCSAQKESTNAPNSTPVTYPGTM